MDVDLDLVRRIEASAAHITLLLVDAMRVVDPGTPASAEAIFGGAMIATGPGRYVNRAMGVTLDERTPAEIDRVEQFYRSRGLPPAFEVSSWTPPATVAELSRREYRLAWFRAMFTTTPDAWTPHTSPRNDVQIALVDESNVDTWMETYAAGFGALESAARVVSDEFAGGTRISPGTNIFLAMIDGRPAGCGALQTCDGVGWVGGAATLPEFRRRGVQAALLGHRVRLAGELGCDLVAATAVPSGQSARNLVRAGFQLVQTQAVLVREAADNHV